MVMDTALSGVLALVGGMDTAKAASRLELVSGLETVMGWQLAGA